MTWALCLAFAITGSCAGDNDPNWLASEPLTGAVIGAEDIPQPASGGPPAEAQPQEAPTDSGLDALPAPGQLARTVNFSLNDGHRNGAEFDAGLPLNLASAAGDNAVFAPDFATSGESGLAGLAYATYSFTLPDYDGSPTDIDFSWSDVPSGASLWLGLGNFTRENWDWFKASSGGSAALDLASLDDYLNLADGLLLVVALTGSDAAILSEIQIQTQEPPVAVLGVDVDSGIAPLEVLFNAGASTDADGTIVNYEWDFNGDGLFNDSAEEQAAEGSSTPAAYTYTLPGTYDAELRVTDNDGKSDTAVRQINVSASQPPVADIQAAPESGNKPLMVLFDASNSSDSDGTITDYEWDFDGDNNFNESNNGENTAQGDSNPPAVTYTVAGEFNATVRVTDDDGGKDTGSVLITVNNSPPTALIQSDVSSGPAPLAVSFDATASSDAGGAIADYEWDFDGDGMFNEPGAEATARGDSNPASFTYTEPGEYTASLRVTDDDDATDTAALVITANGWKIITLPVAGGIFAEVGNIGGHPAIAYRDNDSTGLHYGFSSSTDGTDPADWSFVQVDADSNSGWRSVLREVAGNPAIFYLSQTSGNVKYARAAEPTGIAENTWTGNIVTFDVAITAYFGMSMELISGNPALAYFRESDSVLRYRRSSTATGENAAAWNSGADLTLDGDTADIRAGEWCSLAEIGGNPAIVYRREDTNVGTTWLRYKRASTTTGAALADWSGGATVDIQTDGDYLVYASLAQVNGAPAFSYMHESGGDLKYRRANNGTGATLASWTNAGSSNLTLDSVNTSGFFTSLMVIGGNPAVVHMRENASRTLKFLRAGDASGDVLADWSGGTDEVIEDGNSPMGEWISLDQVAGRPVVAYRSNSAGSTIEFGVRY